MSPPRTTAVSAWRAPGPRALVVVVALVAGCVQGPVVREHPELAARVTRMEDPPESTAPDPEEEAPSDPSVEPASAGDDREAEPVRRRAITETPRHNAEVVLV